MMVWERGGGGGGGGGKHPILLALDLVFWKASICEKKSSGTFEDAAKIKCPTLLEGHRFHLVVREMFMYKVFLKKEKKRARPIHNKA